MTSYWFVRRPTNAEHRHPFLVFDCHDRLHLPLTIFAKEASARVGSKTVQTYLYSLQPFFSWLDTDIWQVRADRRWDTSPQQVRYAIDDYLVSQLYCKVLPHQHGWQHVAITVGTRSTLRIFLAALKMFYQIMRQNNLYTFANPLVDSMSATIAAALAHLEHEQDGTKPPRCQIRVASKRLATGQNIDWQIRTTNWNTRNGILRSSMIQNYQDTF